MTYLWALFVKLVEYKFNTLLTPEQLRIKKEKKFRKFAKYVNKHSTYYKRIIREKNIDLDTCTISDFPVLTKSDVINHFDELLAVKDINKKSVEHFLSHSKNPAELLNNKYHVIHTSGSSGKIGYYVFHKNDFASTAILSLRVAPARFRQKMAFVALTDGHYASSSIAFSSHNSILKHFLRLKAFDIGKTSFEEIIQELNQFKPHFINGYATSIKKLAEAKMRGELKISPQSLASGGEPLLAHDLDFIEQAFGVKISNVYACSEHLFMGIGKKEYGGMYLFEDDLDFEFYEDKLIVTNTFNKTLPLIRYQMSDVLCPIKDDQKFYPFIKVSNIVGRQEFAPVFTNENGEDDFIHPIIFVEFFVKNLNCFQIRYNDKNSFKFYACLNQALGPREKDLVLETIRVELNRILSRKKMSNVRFEVLTVDKIDVDKKTGKFKLIVCE